jgi:para-aminobenzoate synthetase component 1
LFTPSINQIQKEMRSDHLYFPIAVPLEINHEQWFPLYKQINADSAHHALLESGRAGRYSFMAYQPTHTFRGKNQWLTISSLNAKGEVIESVKKEGKLVDLLKGWMTQRRAPRFNDLPDFHGGLLGFFSYDMVREIESLPVQSNDDLNTPDLYMLAFERVIAYDHHTDQHWLLLYQPVVNNDLEKSYAAGQEKLHLWTRELLEKARVSDTQKDSPDDTGKTEASIIPTTDPSTGDKPVMGTSVQEALATGEIKPSFSEEEFIAAVQRIQEYISAGDVFQVNLSVRQSRTLQTEPINIYEQVREINPSPYMAYLHFPDLQVVSASPEQLVKVKDRQMNTRPIAGTRPRGENREQDLQLANELIHNEKERAEHVMLVDLERNDLGKVSQFGSVEVDEFMVIEEYSHVMHIVSNVRGVLSEGKDAFDVIRAVFPGGTITGAPKVRTLEIIEELEPVHRGIYTGSIGWIDFNGDMEMNIVIRTLLAHEGKAHVQAGAGIVIDSVPANEYQESLKKAEALWKAFEQSTKKKELSM